MKLDLPVMLAALLVAAAFQELLPPLPLGVPAPKVQLLPAVALYYLYRRPWPVALTAALWAGILTDALGGLPPGTTPFALLLAGAAVLAVREPGAPRPSLAALAPGAGVALLLGVAQPLGLLAASEGKVPFFASFLAAAKLLPLSALAAAAADAVLLRVERCAGNAGPGKEAALP